MGETAIEEDTVSADEEHDEIEADDGAERLHSAVRVDTVVHDVVPVLAGQYLQPTTDLLTTTTVTVTNQCLRRPDRHRKSLTYVLFNVICYTFTQGCKRGILCAKNCEIRV